MASVLKVDKLDPQSGTALEIGSSGDTITIPSGATFTQSGTMNASAITAGTVATARLGTGTASSSTVLYGDNTWAAVGGIDIDADSWYMTLNDYLDQDSDAVIDMVTVRKTGSNVTESGGVITVGTAGWYLVHMCFANNSDSTDTTSVNIRKNDTIVSPRLYWTSGDGIGYMGHTKSLLVEASASDTFDMYGNGNWHGNTTLSSAQTYWWGYRVGT